MKRFGPFLSMLMLLSMSLIYALPAAAGISTYYYSLSQSDDTLSISLGDDGNPCYFDNVPGTYYYKTATFYVNASGSYYISDEYVYDFALLDGNIAIYSAAFDPGNTAANCLITIDDNEPSPHPVTINLNTGTLYTIVLSTYSNGAFGNFGFRVDGPGEIIFGSSVPNVPGGPEVGAAFDPGDDRINPDAHAPVAIYCRDNGAVEVLNIDAGGNGSQAFLLTGADISAAASGGAVTQVGNVSLYKLADGRLQINAVLLDGKGYAFLWDTCPVTYSETYTIENGQSSLLIARSY